MRKLMAFRLPPESDEHILRLQKALDKKMPGKVSKADVVAWALELTAERLPPPRRGGRSQPTTELQRLRAAVLAQLPEEQRPRRAAGMVADGLDRVRDGVEYWPDPAAAIEHMEHFPSTLDRLPLIAAWLSQLAELTAVPDGENTVDTANV